MSLREPAFRPFPLAAIKPGGWLLQQLRIQADGLSGHLDDFWPDIKDSAWIGGKADGWERMPYWLDGVIPLAWLLNDALLKTRLQKYLDYIITHQHEDGWLGPRLEEKAQAADLWSQFLALKMLIGYHDVSGDKRVPMVVEKALRKLDYHIDGAPLSKWGMFRWFEALIAIWWLYERTSRPWLLELAVKLNGQGFHWGEFFSRWPLTGPTPKGRWNYAGHVVNNAMALKSPGLWWRLSGQNADRRTVYKMIEKLDCHHGAVTGLFTGDECLAGQSPIQGTELCAVVEYMYSLENLLALFGDPAFGDRLEKIAFNALPATFSPDMWAHQYDQQVNQIECSVRENRPWNSNGPDANIFGLEPNFGCCTANLSQGWPKFAAHLWMQTGDGGIAAVAYAPSSVETTIQDVKVAITLTTEYPFREDLAFRIIAQRPVSFPLLLRIPAWAKGAAIRLNGAAPLAVESGKFHKIERVWDRETDLCLKLPMSAHIERRPHHAVSIVRGPLVYALKIGEEWRRIHQDKPFRELPHADWEVYPTTPWNYALKVDEASLSKEVRFKEHPLGEMIFSPNGAPVSARVKGYLLSAWGAENGSVQPIPSNPVQKNEPLEEMTLIPYGCTNLRITEFPLATMRRNAEP